MIHIKPISPMIIRPDGLIKRVKEANEAPANNQHQDLFIRLFTTDAIAKAAIPA